MDTPPLSMRLLRVSKVHGLLHEEEDEEGGRQRRIKRKLFSKLSYIWPNIKVKKIIKLKISESSTLSLQGNVRKYIDTVYYGTLHIL
jgi:hypothetical protein